MFCMNCGTKLPDNAKFCYQCGEKTNVGREQNSVQEVKSSAPITDSEKKIVEKNNVTTEHKEQNSSKDTNTALNNDKTNNSDAPEAHLPPEMTGRAIRPSKPWDGPHACHLITASAAKAAWFSSVKPQTRRMRLSGAQAERAAAPVFSAAPAFSGAGASFSVFQTRRTAAPGVIS